MGRVIAIDNPVPGGNRFTSEQAAQRYVRKGRARLSACGRRLHFIEDDHRHQSALENQLQKDRGYDLRGTLELGEIKKIPVLMPQKLVVIRGRRSKPRPELHDREFPQAA